MKKAQFQLLTNPLILGGIVFLIIFISFFSFNVGTLSIVPISSDFTIQLDCTKNSNTSIDSTLFFQGISQSNGRVKEFSGKNIDISYDGYCYPTNQKELNVNFNYYGVEGIIIFARGSGSLVFTTKPDGKGREIARFIPKKTTRQRSRNFIDVWSPRTSIKFWTIPFDNLLVIEYPFPRGQKEFQLMPGEGIYLSFRPDGTDTLGAGQVNARQEGIVEPRIEVIAYKKLSCIISDSEVRIRRRSGDNFKESDLKYKPTKYCRELPVILERQNADGTTTNEISTKTSIYEKLASGETIDIDGFKSISFDYYTEFVEGVTPKCDPLSEVILEETNTCVQVNFQAQPTEKVLFCNTQKDCLLPSNCNDAVVKCISNKCDYNSAVCTSDQIINEVLVEKQTIQKIERLKKEVKFIPLSDFEITLTHDNSKSFSWIGDELLTSSASSYSCKAPENVLKGGGFFSYEPSRKSCYSSKFKYKGKVYSLIPETKTFIDNCLKVSYIPTGQLFYDDKSQEVFYKNPQDWKNTIILSIKNDENCLDIKGTRYNSDVLIGSTVNQKIQVTNNIANFNNAELFTTTSKDLRQQSDISNKFDITLNRGKNTYTIPIDTEERGIVITTVKIGLNIDEHNIFPSQRVRFIHNVRNEIPKDEKIVEPIQKKELNIFQKILMTIKNIFKKIFR